MRPVYLLYRGKPREKKEKTRNNIQYSTKSTIGVLQCNNEMKLLCCGFVTSSYWFLFDGRKKV